LKRLRPDSVRAAVLSCDQKKEDCEVRRRRRQAIAEDDWTSEVSSGFALAGFLFLAFLGFSLLAMGPLLSLDTYLNLAPAPAGWVPFLHILDRIGQRGICLPIVGIVAYLACRRHESWRPGVVAAVSVFMLNLIVLILKLSFGSGEPDTGDPSFFQGGMAYPSGHSSNIVLVYGLIAYLLFRYFSLGRRTLVLLSGMVALLSVVMVITSMTLDWHWFADLIAGLIVGSMVLQLTATVDALVPDTAFDQGWRAGLRTIRAALPWRRSAPRPQPATEPRQVAEPVGAAKPSVVPDQPTIAKGTVTAGDTREPGPELTGRDAV
jgi:undecaprenyl-diphosphatase